MLPVLRCVDGTYVPVCRCQVCQVCLHSLAWRECHYLARCHQNKNRVGSTPMQYQALWLSRPQTLRSTRSRRTAPIQEWFHLFQTRHRQSSTTATAVRVSCAHQCTPSPSPRTCLKRCPSLSRWSYSLLRTLEQASGCPEWTMVQKAQSDAPVARRMSTRGGRSSMADGVIAAIFVTQKDKCPTVTSRISTVVVNDMI